MRDSTSLLWKVLRTGKPIASVLYEDFKAREELIELSYLVAPSDYEVRRIEEAAEALEEDKFGTLLLLAPKNEIDTIRRLDQGRETLQKRRAPVVLFLLRRGSGLQELTVRRGLAAMLREQEVDPDQVDEAEMETERDRFAQEHKQTPEEWLEAWRGGQKPDTPENNLTLHQALLLERERRGSRPFF